jgi:RNA polymerase sigma-70 factor (ECF subfamily)
MEEFEDIYLRYSPQIYRVCMGYFNDPAAAKDLTQETFIAVWNNLPTFRQESKMSTWIFRIATNICLRAIEKSRRYKVVELPIEIPDVAPDSQDEKLAFLYACIAELKETERIIISLVLEDLPQAEIADIVGVSHGNIRIKIHRIKEKLAVKFKKYEQFQ